MIQVTTLFVTALAGDFDSRVSSPLDSYVGEQVTAREVFKTQKPDDVPRGNWNALKTAVQEAKLQSSLPHEGGFGWSVSISGKWALVGEPANSRVYVFEFHAGTWEQTAELRPPPEDNTQRFGWAISISGNRALIGAPYYRYTGLNGFTYTGAAYIFEFSAGQWIQTNKIVAATQVWVQGFGLAVSLSGNKALIGAPDTTKDLRFDSDGAAYIFDFDGGGWNQTVELLPSDGLRHDYFGTSVSLSGNRALIGTPQWYRDTPYGTGAAYVFDFNGGSWSETAKLLATDGGSGDVFGFSVSLFGNRALVGAVGGFNTDGVRSGAAYVLDFDGTNWNETKILPNDGAQNDLFGYSVSLAHNQILISAPADDDNVNDAGSTYVFELLSQGTWSQEEKLIPEKNTELTAMGYSVSLSSGKAIIGGTWEIDHGSGIFHRDNPVYSSVYIFNVSKSAMVDPACATTNRDCDGRYLQETNSSKTLKNSGSIYPVDDSEVLAKELSVVRSGIITDGTSQILLKIQSDEAVTFEIIQPDGNIASGSFPCKWGTISNFGDSASCSSVTVEPQMTSLGNFVFASYQSPEDFPGLSANDETIISINSISVSNVTTSQPLELRPPPIVLIHGVWSSANAWRGLLRTNEATRIYTFESALRNQGYDVFLVDHSDIDGSAGFFNPFLPSPVIERLIEQGIENARFTLRQRGFVVTQVDVIGHSMGGLIARSRMAYSRKPYFSKENYHKGDFNKLITIGSPHQGTDLADVLIPNKCASRWVCYPRLLNTPTCKAVTLESAFKLGGKPMGPAIHAFQTSSPTLLAMGSTDVTGHAIIGVAPSTPDSDTEDNLNHIFSIFRLDYTIDGIMGGDGGHDTIVPWLSQTGGIVANAYTTVDGIVHAGVELDLWSPDDINETASQVVFSRTLALLKEPVSSDLFSRFSALPSGGNYMAPYECPNTKEAQSIKTSQGTSQATINFTPAEGTIVPPGDTVQIQFDITNGESVDGVLFSINGEFRSISGPPPYSFEITAPANRAGRINISAQTIGSGSEDYGVDSYIIVQPGQAAVSLAVTPFEINFTQPGRSLPLHVIAKYSDETEIDVSSGVTGTIYTTQSGTENIVSINAEGVISAIAVGQDTIVVSNSGQTVFIPIYVSSELKQEEVFANGFE